MQKINENLTSEIQFIPNGTKMEIFFQDKIIGHTELLFFTNQKSLWTCKCYIPEKWIKILSSQNNYVGSSIVPNNIPVSYTIINNENPIITWIPKYSNTFLQAINEIWKTWQILELNNP
ncbi:hypothetical protein QLL95_gp0227 [Cotonvirus japonicus]|uniref:Uncharacterized protein n=1 Tax=Cotonvirus japonicus TaxID=2811091 RepID=A0ABM7NRJ4_9VIRU|nr:hypothetical protein QLL95_gp0227 [Cotonvirus japonicus]BCS82716.1 hypothetical protein [Cotonvirus japonicus]